MLQTVFVKQLRFASLVMLFVGTVLWGTTGMCWAARLLPIHALVLSQPSRQHVILRIDPFPGLQGPTTRKVRWLIIDQAQTEVTSTLLSGSEIDAFLDVKRNLITEVHPAHRYTAGNPDVQILHELQIGDHLPDLHFIDSRGQVITLSALRGKTLVLSFFYTRCPDKQICPAISGRFAYLQSRMNSERMRLLEITVDPRHDSPATLAAYGEQFGADPEIWHLLTAQQHTIADSLALFGLSNLQTDPAAFVHDDVLAIIGPDGRLQQTITTAGWSPDDVLATLAHLNGQQGNWLRRFELSAVAKLVSACGGSTTAAIAIMDSVVFIAGVIILGAVLAWFAKKIWQPYH